MARRLTLAPGLLALLFAGRLAAQPSATPEQAGPPAEQSSSPPEPPLPPDPAAHPFEPPPPPVKPFSSRSHALLGFHVGFPGALDRDGAKQDLASTFGFNMRGDEPLAQYVLLGPMLQFGSWRPAQPASFGHSYFIDLDLVLRFRVPITTEKLNYQVWLGMPVGISGDVPSKDFTNASPGIGWNIGVLFGGAIHFAPKFGLFAEVGWEQHRLSHTRDGESDLDVELQQALLNLGIVLRN